MEVSCLTNPPLTPAGSCVSQFEYGLATGYGIFFGPSATDLQRYVDCANASSNCTDALNCASGTHGPDWCSAHPNGACDGDVLVECIASWGLIQRDCTVTGQHCATANGYSACTDGKTCDPKVTAHCDANHLVECDGATKLESSIDCGAFVSDGMCVSTVMNGSGTTGCFPPASASCPAGVESARCDGTAGVICELGLETRVECGQFASHCVIDGSGKFRCVPDAGNCTDSMPDTCVGSALQLCVNGNLAQTSCSGIGLSMCQASGNITKCQ